MPVEPLRLTVVDEEVGTALHVEEFENGLLEIALSGLDEGERFLMGGIALTPYQVSQLSVICSQHLNKHFYRARVLTPRPARPGSPPSLKLVE